METAEIDLARCLERVQLMDQEAAVALVEHLYPLVIRIVRAHLPRRTDEKDLAQEVFLKMFARLSRYQARGGSPFEHWVSRLAVRTCLDALRAERRRPEVRWSDLSEEHSAWLEYMLLEHAPAPDTAASSARELLDKLMSRLAPRDRLIITLMDLEQKTVKEVGAVTGWSIPLVKVAAFRARRRLRKLAEDFKKQNQHEGF